jgi:pimeloyl-ACP methyl ester carboxylesterase
MPRINLPNQIIEYSVADSGPPVMLIQGVGVAGSGWEPQMKVLANSFTAASFDHRGIGVSAAENQKFSLRDLSADTLKIMDHLGWKDAHLVGHSMEGMIAQEIALSCPERVRSLALICTFSQGKEATRFSPRLIWLGLKTRIGSRQNRRWAMLRLIVSKKFYDTVDLDRAAEEFGKLMGRDLASSPPVIMRQLRAMAKYLIPEGARMQIKVPTLVISATEDPIAPPRFGRHLARFFPNARYFEIKGASHAVTIEDAEQINEILMAHLGAIR